MLQNNDTEEETINVIIGEEDSELIQRLKEIIEKTPQIKSNTY